LLKEKEDEKTKWSIKYYTASQILGNINPPKTGVNSGHISSYFLLDSLLSDMFHLSRALPDPFDIHELSAGL